MWFGRKECSHSRWGIPESGGWGETQWHLYISLISSHTSYWQVSLEGSWTHWGVLGWPAGQRVGGVVVYQSSIFSKVLQNHCTCQFLKFNCPLIVFGGHLLKQQTHRAHVIASPPGWEKGGAKVFPASLNGFPHIALAIAGWHACLSTNCRSGWLDYPYGLRQLHPSIPGLCPPKSVTWSVILGLILLHLPEEVEIDHVLCWFL